MNFKKNTGKAPSIQLYYKDLLADIQEHGNEFVGAWIKILCHIWHDSKDGSITKTIAQFSRIIGENEADTLRIISYFSEENIATVTHANGKITVINRRVQKDLKLKEQNRLRQRKFKAKRENNGEVTTILPNPSSSSSSSSSSSTNNTVSNNYVIFDNARKQYPGTKRGLKTEFINFQKKYKDWKEVLPLLAPSIQKQIAWRKNTTAFVPQWKNFQTWINNRCWEDEVAGDVSQPEVDSVSQTKAMIAALKKPQTGVKNAKKEENRSCRVEAEIF